jgi:hypothetical protein
MVWILIQIINKTVVTRYRMALEQKRYDPATINLRVAPVRRLAYEGADCGLLSADLAAGIRRVRGARRLGIRVQIGGIGPARNSAPVIHDGDAESVLFGPPSVPMSISR